MIGEFAKSSDLGKRDAVHAPIVCVTSKENLSAGENVRFVDQALTEVVKCGKMDKHAVVDPFLTGNTKGKFFQVLLIPNITSNLQHHYEVNLVIDGPDPQDDLKKQIKELQDILREKEIDLLSTKTDLKDAEKTIRDLEAAEDDYDGCKGCY